MFFQPRETYPDDKMFIGRWLGPEIDVGTAMTYKILRPDGGYVCRSTVIFWTSKEEANLVRMAERVYFMKQLNSCIVHAAKLSGFPLNDVTDELSIMQMESKMELRGPLMISRKHLLQHQRLRTTMLDCDFSCRVVKAWNKIEC